MKRYHLIFVVASIAALFSCSKETASNIENEAIKEPSTGVTIPENPQTMTLSACFETDDPEVKTYRDGNKVLWESTDKIAVVAKVNDEVRYYNSEPAGEGGSSVEFQVNVDPGAELLYAIYPAGLLKTVPVIGESSVTVPVPAVQDGSFANANITVAKIKGEKLTFRNICNLVKFEATSDITKAQICVLDSRNLAGEAVVSFDDSGISITANATADRVTLENLKGAGTYYFATLPDATPWTGFGLRIGNASGYKPGIIGSKSFPKNTRGTVTNVGIVDERIQVGDYNLTFDKANELADLIASDMTSSTTRKNIAKAWRIHNKTINLTPGTYDMGKEIMVEFGGADEWVNINIVGEDLTSVNIVGGAEMSQSRRIMEIGNKTRLSCKQITFKDACLSGKDGDGAGFMFHNSNSGISFENCRFTNLKNSTDMSGGVFKLEGPTVNFTHCTFDGNFAKNGGVYFQYEGTANFTDCKFENNEASNVGGVFSDAKGKSKFDNCVFKSCSAVNGGGAMASFDNDVNVTVKNSRFEACHSRQGGAIIAKKTSTTTLENVVFEGCYSDGQGGNPGGGALYIFGEGSATINAKKCKFNGCYTESNGEGGAYQLRAGTLNVEDSDFTGNYTNGSKPGGVGHNWGSSTMSFTRCNFVGNISSKNAYQGTGGNTSGVHFAGTGATLKYTECVFDGNAASNASCFEVCANCYVAFDGCEFKNNEAGSTGVIKNNDNTPSIVLVNNCSFHDNKQRNDDNAQIFNGGDKGQFFCYNTTIYRNTQSGTVGNGSLISTNGSMAIVSSTLIANSSRSVIQQNKDWNDVVALIMNSILLNENENAQRLICGDKTTPYMKNGGYNIVAPQDPNALRKFTLGETDVQDAKMSYLAGGQFNAETGKYMWNGPSAERSLASVDAIKTFLNKNLKPTNFNNNANIIDKDNLGATFVAWLESIKAFDSRPQAGLWPGAYQNNQ